MINISLFEVVAVTMARFANDLDLTQQAAVRDKVMKLVNDDDFSRAITYSTNSTQAVRARFKALEQMMQSAGLR